jgi:hypothetical protein
MRLGWKVFLPFTLLYVVLVAGVLVYTDSLPAISLIAEESGVSGRVLSGANAEFMLEGGR